MKKIFLSLIVLLPLIMFGQNWTEVYPSGTAANKNWQIVTSDNDGTFYMAVVYGGRIYVSADGGATWAEKRPNGDANFNWMAAASDNDGSLLVAGAFGKRLWTSANSGTSWTERRPNGDLDEMWTSAACSHGGSVILAVTDTGRVYLSVNSGANWAEEQPAGDDTLHWNVTAMNSDGGTLFVANSDSTMYASYDTASTWAEVKPAGDTALAWSSIHCSAYGQYVIAAVGGGRVYITSDSSATWTEVSPTGVADTNVNWTSVVCDLDFINLIATSSSGRAYTSDDSGTTWTEIQPAGDADKAWKSSDIESYDGSTLIAAVYGGRVYIADYLDRDGQTTPSIIRNYSTYIVWEGGADTTYNIDTLTYTFPSEITGNWQYNIQVVNDPLSGAAAGTIVLWVSDDPDGEVYYAKETITISGSSQQNTLWSGTIAYPKIKIQVITSGISSNKIRFWAAFKKEPVKSR